MKGLRRRHQQQDHDEVRAEGSIGFPGLCPECGGGGFLDHIDLVRGIQHHTCRECGIRFELAIGEMAEDEVSPPVV
jgi:hypothetical protein